MSMKVKQIDVYAIEDKLKKDKSLSDIWHYVKALKEALVRQQELTGKAISKLREVSKH